MKKSVMGVLIFRDELLVVKRQDYLQAFPGYSSFPGGKVEKLDTNNYEDLELLNKYPSDLMSALCRELEEECGINLEAMIKNSEVEDIIELGIEKSVVFDVLNKVDKSEYKRRQVAPGVKLTPKAFGKDRRMPISVTYEREIK